MSRADAPVATIGQYPRYYEDAGLAVPESRSEVTWPQRAPILRPRSARRASPGAPNLPAQLIAELLRVVKL
jgi:hypothetical protein